MDKSILEVVHESVLDLKNAGLVDEKTMRSFNKLCLPKVKKFSAKKIKQIRKENSTSQAVFAAYLNTSISTIQKWEQGKKQPNGPSLKLLNLVENNGIGILT